MLEGVLKGRYHCRYHCRYHVSILGMLEGVLKAFIIVGANIALGFNPWYVGGGVKSFFGLAFIFPFGVSILGMLEGVLKDLAPDPRNCPEKFQSLVCWRGC